MSAHETRPANHLANETSPYLLQHARNPVDWHPWGDEALDKARAEDKLLLISIGYSACHWCHVMERESFEDEETARLMNGNYVCIKVDREERPDIDQVYMNAVQLVSGQGGWPLNCFALPDGRPVYGGTYFRNTHWKEVLRTLAELYRQEPERVRLQAEHLTRGIQQSELVRTPAGAGPVGRADVEAAYRCMASNFDHREGGPDRAPKFPLPNNYQFLLRYGHAAGEDAALGHAALTLRKMAFGGIHDHLGGGFARYSTDHYWKVPHFEKMLYDNAQLLELYAEAYQAGGDPLYREVAYGIAGFIEREMTSPEGGFYSALDADSEGEEGRYYVWTKAELEAVLGGRFALFADYYNVDSQGYWEDGRYILLRKDADEEVAQRHGMRPEAMRAELEKARAAALAARGRRVRPGLDDKVLTSWNALMCKGLLTAYNAFGERRFLGAAERCLAFLIARGRREDGGLFHNCKDGRFGIGGFLEDYAFMIEALISLYQATFRVRWLEAARELAEYCRENFLDRESGMFFFTSAKDRALAARKTEIMDNVIPGSNSAMAKGLFLLGTLYGEESYRDAAREMLSAVRRDMETYGSSFSNWAMLAMWMAFPFHEIVVTGPGAMEARGELARAFLPGAVLAGGDDSASLPLLQGRREGAETLIHVCREGRCELPSRTVAEALARIRGG